MEPRAHTHETGIPFVEQKMEKNARRSKKLWKKIELEHMFSLYSWLQPEIVMNRI